MDGRMDDRMDGLSNSLDQRHNDQLLQARIYFATLASYSPLPVTVQFYNVVGNKFYAVYRATM